MPAERAYVPNMAASLLTAEELLHTHVPNKRVELVRGVLVVHEPPGYEHGRITAELGFLLVTHIKETRAGQLLIGDSGFKVAADPDTVRGPDIAFLRSERLPDPHTRGFPALGPDLVVEVLSPSDRPGETLAKVGDWLEGGVRLVWVIDPARRLTQVYRQDGSTATIRETEPLDGEDVLPGFSCRLTAILSG
ncbi:MAG TPA: Uma2 family endonuclease [Gemmatimonadales bacterium]|nr:Uma2 family endonuclease [Gemmatimonadales bacterium]